MEGKDAGEGGHARRKEPLEQRCGHLKAEVDPGMASGSETRKRCLGGPPIETVSGRQQLTDPVYWLPPSDALPGINCVRGNEFGTWTTGWLK